MTNSKSHMGFRLSPRSMTLDDVELHKFEFSVNFSGFRRFRTQQQQNAWRWASIVSDNGVSTSNWSNFWHAFASRGFVSDSWAFLFSIAINRMIKKLIARLIMHKSGVSKCVYITYRSDGNANFKNKFHSWTDSLISSNQPHCWTALCN